MRVIAGRVEALARFTRAYAQLARVPRPALQPVRIADVIARVVALESRMRITTDGSDIVINADADQLEQLLINIAGNAVDAALETGGGVAIRWRTTAEHAIVTIEDEGLGIAATANLFIPFFTTKPAGNGIGLVLSRQIAEAHGGTLMLENRGDGRGAVATLRLPI
jgi:signal transduction histidine kinase